jgi:surface antigen
MAMGHVMIKSGAALLLLIAAPLGGCDATSGTATGGVAGAFSAPSAPAFGRPGEGAAAAVNNAALGGLISPKIGAALDDNDRRLAYDAQIEALERGSPGAPVAWRNPGSGRFGNIVPGPAYMKQGATCRGYSHTVTIAGQLEIARGTACRGSDGGWNAIS